jgi:hypothetical protein
MQEQFHTEDEIAAVVSKLEACAFAPDEFSHRLHIAAALWYLSRHPYDDAVGLMRGSLRRFLAHHGIQGYNETMTLFWMRLLAHLLETRGNARPFPDVVNEAVQEFGSMRPVSAHYSKAVISSETAKAGWVEPDLQPLPF